MRGRAKARPYMTSLALEVWTISYARFLLSNGYTMPNHVISPAATKVSP